MTRVGRKVGLRDDRDRAAGQPLGDVVVGLADETQFDARTGERAERLAGRATQVEPDRAVELAALEGAGQAGPERAVGGGQAQTGRGRPIPGRGTRRRSRASSDDAGHAADLAARRRSGSRAAPRWPARASRR